MLNTSQCENISPFTFHISKRLYSFSIIFLTNFPLFFVCRSNQGPAPPPPQQQQQQKVVQSKSMSAMPPPAAFEADQHTYQNHRPNFPPPQQPQQPRSTSVGNLTMPRSGGHHQMPAPGGMNGQVRFPSQQDIAGAGTGTFDQGYYQNVGGGHNGHTQLQQHMPLRYSQCLLSRNLSLS